MGHNMQINQRDTPHQPKKRQKPPDQKTRRRGQSQRHSIKPPSTKVLMYSTENYEYIQYHVINHNGEEYIKERMYLNHSAV